VRVVFFGSPDFAVPSLRALVAERHEVALVVSQPAKPVGRGGAPADPVVAREAAALGLPRFQPASLKGDDAVSRLAEAAADLFVVVAYGKILPQRVLDLPRVGCLNVHGSVLPRWRGASPVQAALLAGDLQTGVSLMRMDAGMDTGPVYAVERTAIGETEDAGALSARLAELGAALLVRRLPAIAAGELSPTAQDDELATACPKIRREDGRVDFGRPAAELVRRWRAFSPWPGLFAFRGEARVKLSGVREVAPRDPAQPGTVLEVGERLVLACGSGAIGVEALQAEGRRALPAAEFARGERVTAGELWR